MSIEKMFEYASRHKLRFETSQGQLSVEDLWGMPLVHTKLTSLDDIALELNKLVKDVGEPISFVNPDAKSDKDEAVHVKFELVKYIISIKLEDMKAVTDANERKARKQHLLSLLAEKEGEQLKSLSAEELKKMIADL